MEEQNKQEERELSCAKCQCNTLQIISIGLLKQQTYLNLLCSLCGKLQSLTLKGIPQFNNQIKTKTKNETPNYT